MKVHVNRGAQVKKKDKSGIDSIENDRSIRLRKELSGYCRNGLNVNLDEKLNISHRNWLIVSCRISCVIG